ncbi:MAG TPA: M28 family peptidase [Armatimonadota bacterium]|nr:M28 family peptidase [Armatimonadota bacterium]HQK93610.1 M28 family peptidase [Armatimonadota bacterium]
MASSEGTRATIEHLSEAIGPRPCGSEGEHRAAEWVASRLRDLAFEVTQETFRCAPGFALTFLLLTLTSFAALGLMGRCPACALAMALAALIGFVAEGLGRPVVSRLLPQTESRNTVGRRAATARAARVVVVTAHIDSAYAGLVFRPRVVRWFRAIFVGLLGAMIYTLVLCALQLRCTVPDWVTLPAAAHLYWVALCLTHQVIWAKPVPGAGDNASGVAALLAVAEELPPLATTEVWLVATGAEEAGLYGMSHLLSSHAFARDRTMFVNIDNVGAGPLRLISHEGILVPMAADPGILEAAKKAMAALGLECRVEAYRTLPVESAVALASGYRALSIMGSLQHWHQECDVAARVDASVAAQAAGVVTEMLVRWDSATPAVD